MKICFLSSMHPAKDKRVFDKEAISLVAAEHAVTHLCPGNASESGIDKGVKIVTYARPAGIKGRLFQLFRLYRMARREDADCYHCNEVDSWLVGVLLKIFTKKRCVFDVHEHYPSTFAESRFPKWLQSMVDSGIRVVFRMLIPFTDRLVLAKQTVSKDFHCSESKKVLVRNFTPLSGVAFAEDRCSISEGEIITIVHLGLFSKVRGWPQVLDALNLMRHKNVRLEIIGEFNDGTRDEFETVVREHGLENRIVVHDWMPFEKAFEYLTNAHIGLVVFQPDRLNHVYAMPHKMFDYMAAGMAVICPDFAVEVAPVVQETACGMLVDTSNPEDLAEKLDDLVSNPDLIHEMGLKGQQAVRERYNWEVEVERLVKMYERWDRNK